MADRYQFVLSHPLEEGRLDELVYFPYWRFKGTLYAVARNGLNHRLVDVSYRAAPIEEFPISMGLRTQAMRLRFVGPDMPGEFLQPSLDCSQIVEMVMSSFTSSFPRPIYFEELIGETLSLIYAPFYLQDGVVDAVLQRKVSGPIPTDLDLASLVADRPNWSVKFVATLCPQCGWDMHGEKDSIALYCRQCTSVWYPSSDGFARVTFGAVRSQIEDVVYLPFYRIRADVQGLQLKDFRDLAKISNSVRIVEPGMQTQPFHFWSPAFKVRAKEFLHFSSVLTLNQPDGIWEQHIPSEPIFPVNLAYSEAAESLMLSLAGFAKPQRVIFQKLREIKIHPIEWMLVYLPFQQRGLELSHPKYLLRVNKNLINYARSQ